MIERLERGIAELEGPAKPGGPLRMPASSPKPTGNLASPNHPASRAAMASPALA